MSPTAVFVASVVELILLWSYLSNVAGLRIVRSVQALCVSQDKLRSASLTWGNLDETAKGNACY